MKNISLRQAWEEVQGIFNKKVDAVIVVDIGSNLKLLNVELAGEAKITALEIVEFAGGSKIELALSSIRSFIQKNNIQHKNAILRPSLNSLLIKRMQLPAIPEAELLEAVKWQLKSEVSFDLSATVIDFSIVKETVKEDGKRLLDIVCTVAWEEEIRPQVLLLKQLGLNCLAVAPLVSGYTKFLNNYYPDNKEHPIAILHIEEESSFLSIHKDNKLEFYRGLPLSINKLKESLKGKLVSDKGNVELLDSEVDDVLFKVGIPQQGMVYKDKLSSLQILSLLRPDLERLAQEVKRSLAYFSSQFQGEAVNKVVVAGLGAVIPNIEKFLGQELFFNTEKISLADTAIASSGINSNALLQGYPLFGLALEHKQGVNLLPHEFHAEKFEKVQKVSLRWAVFIASILLALSYIFASLGVSNYKKRLDNAILHLNVLSEIKQIKTKTDELSKFITDTRNSEPPICNSLKKIGSITNRDFFIEDFSLNSVSKAVVITGFIKEGVRNPDTVLTKFVRDMEDSSYFTNANISSVQKLKTEDSEIVRFNTTFRLP